MHFINAFISISIKVLPGAYMWYNKMMLKPVVIVNIELNSSSVDYILQVFAVDPYTMTEVLTISYIISPNNASHMLMLMLHISKALI